jgi:hypothetical protein
LDEEEMNAPELRLIIGASMRTPPASPVPKVAEEMIAPSLALSSRTAMKSVPAVPVEPGKASDCKDAALWSVSWPPSMVISPAAPDPAVEEEMLPPLRRLVCCAVTRTAPALPVAMHSPTPHARESEEMRAPSSTSNSPTVMSTPPASPLVDVSKR